MDNKLDPLAQAYKEQFPGISDESAAIQALLNRFAASAGPEWKRVPIAPGAYLLTTKEDKERIK